MIVVLLGPPGSGKGTQAKRLWKERQWPQLSTGDMLRTAIGSGSKLGQEAKTFMEQGSLVPDSVVVALIEERSQLKDCNIGFILDGFPRNIAQAESLDVMLKQQGRQVDRVVLFEMPDSDLVRRLSGRRTCLNCGAMYHIENMRSKVTGICDQCGNSLIHRDDDQPKVIEKRLGVYHQQTEPLIGFYRAQKKLRSIVANRTAEEVQHSLLDALR